MNPEISLLIKGALKILVVWFASVLYALGGRDEINKLVRRIGTAVVLVAGSYAFSRHFYHTHP